MRLSHIEYPALLLIDIRAVDDDAFEFVQFESSCICQWVCMRGGWIESYVPDSIKSEIRAGVPAPIPMLILLVIYLGKRYWIDVPCTLQKLLSVLEFDVFREELSHG